MIHRETIQEEWKEENLSPFNELMVSWNARRPSEGKYLIYASVKTTEWSPWLLYATWGSDGQSSYHTTLPDAHVSLYQDALEVMNEIKATGFRIKVVTEGDAVLEGLHGVHVYTNGDRTQIAQQKISYSSPVYLQVPGLSQITLKHIRYMSFCSPTSTTAVVRYLLKSDQIDPIEFAQKVWDSGFDIYGNWVFNVAQASTELGPSWNSWVERLDGFDPIYERLLQGVPVVVSVRGPLERSAFPYSEGHLIAVIGYDPDQQEVICMDPAFSIDSKTHVRYKFSDFLEAWNRRGRIAYLFSLKNQFLHI